MSLRHARLEVLGRLIEVREADFGVHMVLLEGRIISRQYFAWFTGGSSHFFDLNDEHGVSHHIEVQMRAWRVGRTPAYVLINGAEVATLQLESRRRGQKHCPHCTYLLAGLPIENGEVRCPECGKHSSTAVLGLVKGAQVVPGQARERGA